MADVIWKRIWGDGRHGYVELLVERIAAAKCREVGARRKGVGVRTVCLELYGDVGVIDWLVDRSR
jgi:hypothetical protein